MIRNTISEFRDENFKYDHIHYENMDWTGIESQTHSGYEMIFLKSGEVTYIAEEKIFNVKPGSIILTPPGVMHIIDFNDRTCYDRFDAIFDISFIHPEIFGTIPKGANVFQTHNSDGFYAIFKKLDFYCKYCSGDALKKILLNLIEEIFYNIALESRNAPSYASYNPYTTDSGFAKAIEYIDQNITNNFSLEKMCEDLFISKSYLHKIFSRHLQVTPKKYIVSKRLVLALHEILAGSKPTEIYEKYGFTDYSSFFRSYKAYFGHRPSKK